MKIKKRIDCATSYPVNQLYTGFDRSSLMFRTQRHVVAVCLYATLSACGSVSTPSKEPDRQPVNDISRLDQLWEQRRRENFASDYPLGPGDVVEVNVSGVDEFRNLTERITGEGVLVLPFVGRIQAKGMTDKELRAEIRRRLETKYVRNPQVSLFVKEFRSRQVAVIGAVQKPGLYSLASPADTILSMISQAGGPTATAAERILLIPAEPADPDKAKEIISAMPVRLLSQDPSPLILKNVEPLTISVDGVNKTGQEKYLNMPVQPGDIVLLPGAGEALVQGWVARPGSYKISPGLTVLGVIAAAGGLAFPADSAAVEVIRNNSTGHKFKIVANLDAIIAGTDADVPLREGDVVDVLASNPKLFAWGFYRFFTTVVNVGASV